VPSCPKCGNETNDQIKTWSMMGIGDDKKNVKLGFFVCSQCENRFLSSIEKKETKSNFISAVKEIKGVEKELSNMLGDLKEKIENLKTERAELLEQIEELKKMGETKADTLEDEIASLREEVESLKELLTENE
jgi:peptidoglycan hydrolase CwlO-like protein